MLLHTRFTTKIVKGSGRGGIIGLPTINCAVPQDFSFKHGVYAGWVYKKNRKYAAAIHFGKRPTFNEDDILLEVHILEKIDSAFGKTLNLELTRLIRKTKQFKNTEKLLDAVRKDIKAIKQYLDI